MAKLVDAPDSKSGSGNRVGVQVPLPAPSLNILRLTACAQVIAVRFKRLHSARHNSNRLVCRPALCRTLLSSEFRQCCHLPLLNTINPAGGSHSPFNQACTLPSGPNIFLNFGITLTIRTPVNCCRMALWHITGNNSHRVIAGGK